MITPDELPPRCLGCWYDLEGLAESRCPECGRPFDLADPGTYTVRPPFLFWRFWLPAFALAVVVGTALFMVMFAMGEVGWGATVATPAAIGALLGYRCRVRPITVTLLALCAGLAIVMTLISAQVMGLLCGIMALAIIGVPLVVGALAGWLLRARLKNSPFDQRSYLPLIGFIVIPPLIGIVERATASAPPLEVVHTSIALDIPPERAWERLAFYEDLPDERPWLLRIAGPVPVRTIHESGPTGPRRTCVYRRGRLTKQVTESTAPRRLAFDIVEQSVGEERSVTLLGGSFDLEPHGAGTRVTLTTRYQPRLRPRFCWRLAEYRVVHAVHQHVLNGMTRPHGSAVARAAEGG